MHQPPRVTTALTVTSPHPATETTEPRQRGQSVSCLRQLTETKAERTVGQLSASVFQSCGKTFEVPPEP